MTDEGRFRIISKMKKKRETNLELAKMMTGRPKKNWD